MIGQKLKGLFSWRTFALAIGVLVIATFINLFGVHILGGLEQWEQWRRDSYWFFFAWRILLYTALIWGWIRIRPRIVQRPSTDPVRLRLAEWMLAVSITLMEITRALPHLSQ